MGEVGATTPVPDGVDLKSVDAALDWAMAQEEQNTRAFVVAYDGKIIGERYAPGWTKDTYWPGGFMGQVTMIIPSRKLVVVRMGPSPGGVYP